ncbi:hypothetical protein VXN63_02240 [Marinilactibacillus sp. XAAS-LB27]|uniref:hypothetical protein n=1 Tax=Marinilactibacillus sp. XAAS-LB27 TaxID=3114538 RepID=UPI002E18A98D|nr:hypothetical protein [Marinilactibacillus sp. XAAS-LB27]
MSKKKRVINKSKYPNLHQLNKVRQNKKVDEVAQTMLSIISSSGLTVDEVAAINYYTMQEILNSEHNKRFMKENLKLDVSKLGPDGIFAVQQALISTYYEKIKENGK